MVLIEVRGRNATYHLKKRSLGKNKYGFVLFCSKKANGRLSMKKRICSREFAILAYLYASKHDKATIAEMFEKRMDRPGPFPIDVFVPKIIGKYSQVNLETALNVRPIFINVGRIG